MGEPDPDAATGTTHGARDHARAQAATRVELQPSVPASSAAPVVDSTGATIAPERLLFDDRIGVGGDTACVLPRGAVLRITDVDGDACAGLLAYHATRPAERLNVADTVKVQWQAYLGPGSLLLSDMGRVLLSIRADDARRHDTFCGTSNRARNEERYGSGDVHGAHPNGRDRFAVALAKHGLARRDIVPNVNLFAPVVVDDDGSLRHDGTLRAPGAAVELRTELPVLVVVVNVPHVLDPRADYGSGPLHLTAWRDVATARDDPLWSSTPEVERAFLQTEELTAGHTEELTAGQAQELTA